MYTYMYIHMHIYISYPHKGIIRDSSGDMTSLSAFEAPEDSEAMSFLRRCGHQVFSIGIWETNLPNSNGK